MHVIVVLSACNGSGSVSMDTGQSICMGSAAQPQRDALHSIGQVPRMDLSNWQLILLVDKK